MAAIIKRKKNTKIYPHNEKYWEQVETQAHYLIADILNQKLPLPNLRDKKNFDLEEDADYRTILADYYDQYGANLPSDSQQISHEIAYEYLLEVSKSILGTLKSFACHDSEYFEDLTD